MKHNIYLYILVMAAVTYLIRVLPLTLIKKEIKNKTVRSFLFYVPYVTLAVMTFPAILTASNSMYRIRRGADPCMAQDKHVCGVACFVCDCVYTGAIYVRYHTNFTEMAKICKKNHWIKFAFFPIYLYNKANSFIQ